MEAGKIKKKLSLAGVLSLIVVALCVFIFLTLLREVRRSAYDDNSVLQTGLYDVTVNGVTEKGVDISKFQFETVKRGSSISYSTVLMGERLDNPILTVYLVHSTARIYLDDELIFSYGDEDAHMLGYGYVNASLPADYIGRTIRVDLKVMESGEVSSVYAPRVYNARNQLHNLIDQNGLYLIVDVALMVLSLTIMITSVFFMNLMPSLKSLISLAVAFFCMSIWELCSYNLIWIFSDSLSLRGYLEYISLYTAPFFLTLYFFNDFYRRENGRLRYAYLTILTMQGIFPVLAIILHFTDICHLSAILLYSHMLLFAAVLFLLVMLIRQVVKKQGSHKILLIGLILLISLGISDIIRFNIYRYVEKSSQVHYTSYLLNGFFIFMIMMVVDFFMNQRKGLFIEAENQALNRLAYVDMLTNLANRRRCEDTFDELALSSEVFGIISFDMNGLKVTNDHYGHLEGDRLLVDFAELLSKVFSQYGIVGRMGGDEFIVILPGVDHIQFELVEQELEEQRKVVNIAREPLPLSYAYGYCRSDDPELKHKRGDRMAVNEVYKLSDERMYLNKVAMKAKSEVDFYSI